MWRMSGQQLQRVSVECVKQEVEGITLVLSSRFKEMQLFIDEKELSVTKVKITTLM